MDVRLNASDSQLGSSPDKLYQLQRVCTDCVQAVNRHLNNDEFDHSDQQHDYKFFSFALEKTDTTTEVICLPSRIRHSEQHQSTPTSFKHLVES